MRASRAFDRTSRRAAAIASAVAITSLALAPIAPRCDDDPDGDAFVDLKGLQTWDENWDGRAHSPQETHPSRGLLSRLTSIRAPAPELKKLTKPPAVAVGGTRYIILVRHGQVRGPPRRSMFYPRAPSLSVLDLCVTTRALATAAGLLPPNECPPPLISPQRVLAAAAVASFPR